MQAKAPSRDVGDCIANRAIPEAPHMYNIQLKITFY